MTCHGGCSPRCGAGDGSRSRPRALRRAARRRTGRPLDAPTDVAVSWRLLSRRQEPREKCRRLFPVSRGPGQLLPANAGEPVVLRPPLLLVTHTRMAKFGSEHGRTQRKARVHVEWPTRSIVASRLGPGCQVDRRASSDECRGIFRRQAGFGRRRGDHAVDPAKPQRVWVHWVLYNLPPTVRLLPQRVTNRDLPAGAGMGINDWRVIGFGSLR